QARGGRARSGTRGGPGHAARLGRSRTRAGARDRREDRQPLVAYHGAASSRQPPSPGAPDRRARPDVGVTAVRPTLTRRELVRGGAGGAAAAVAYLIIRGTSSGTSSPPLEPLGVDAAGTGFAGV